MNHKKRFFLGLLIIFAGFNIRAGWLDKIFYPEIDFNDLDFGQESNSSDVDTRANSGADNKLDLKHNASSNDNENVALPVKNMTIQAENKPAEFRERAPYLFVNPGRNNNIDNSKALVLFSADSHETSNKHNDQNKRDTNNLLNKVKSIKEDDRFKASVGAIAVSSAIGGALYVSSNSFRNKCNALGAKVKKGFTSLKNNGVSKLAIAKAGGLAVAALGTYLGCKKLNKAYQINQKAKDGIYNMSNYISENKKSSTAIAIGGISLLSLVGFKLYSTFKVPCLPNAIPQGSNLWKEQLYCFIDTLNPDQWAFQDIQILLDKAFETSPEVLKENQDFMNILDDSQKECIDIILSLYDNDHA